MADPGFPARRLKPGATSSDGDAALQVVEASFREPGHVVEVVRTGVAAARARWASTRVAWSNGENMARLLEAGAVEVDPLRRRRGLPHAWLAAGLLMRGLRRGVSCAGPAATACGCAGSGVRLALGRNRILRPFGRAGPLERRLAPSPPSGSGLPPAAPITAFAPARAALISSTAPAVASPPRRLRSRLAGRAARPR